MARKPNKPRHGELSRLTIVLKGEIVAALDAQALLLTSTRSEVARRIIYDFYNKRRKDR